jgi:hypothetical protein
MATTSATGFADVLLAVARVMITVPSSATSK